MAIKWSRFQSSDEIYRAWELTRLTAEVAFYKDIALSTAALLEDLRNTTEDGGVVTVVVGHQRVELQKAPT